MSYNFSYPAYNSSCPTYNSIYKYATRTATIAVAQYKGPGSRTEPRHRAAGALPATSQALALSIQKGGELWRAARDASTQVLDQEHREVDRRRFGRRNKRLAAYLQDEFMSVRSGTAPLATEVGRDMAWAPRMAKRHGPNCMTSSDASRQFFVCHTQESL